MHTIDWRSWLALAGRAGGVHAAFAFILRSLFTFSSKRIWTWASVLYLYVSSDFGVYKRLGGFTQWNLAAGAMPNVEVSGLTIVPGARVLYAATHGLGAWALKLR